MIKIGIIKLMTKTTRWWLSRQWRLKDNSQPLDKSWLVYAGLLGVILGVVLELVWPINVKWLVMLMVILALFWRKSSLVRLVLILTIGVMIGSWRARAVFERASQYQLWFGQTVELSGRLVDDVSITESGNRLLKLTEVKINQQSMVGNVMISTRQKLAIARGDYLIAFGDLEAGIGKYQAKLNRLQSIEVVSKNDAATGLRDWLERRLRKFISGERADLISAIVLGKRANLRRNIHQQIRTVGLSHIVVASGLHLMIMVGLFKSLFARISRRWQLFGSLAVATVFGLTAGLSASMMRALAALAVLLATWFYGRKISGWRLIILLVSASLLINPLHLSGDLSWWLSYGAFFGVLVAVPAVQNYLFGDKKLNTISQLLLAVLVVQVVVAPILLVGFGELSLISPLANLLVVPLLVLLMWLAGLVIMLADLSFLAWLMAYPLQLISSYILNVMQILAQFPRALVKLNLNNWQIAAWVVLVGLAIAWMSYKNWRLERIKHLQKISKITSLDSKSV